MLNAFWRVGSLVFFTLSIFLLFSISATYANEDSETVSSSEPLTLESEVSLPIGLWPPIDNDAAEDEPEEAPSMALIPPTRH